MYCPRKERKMRVILLADIPGKGNKGDIIDVSDGYANNFLIAKGLAAVAPDEDPNKSKDDAAIFHQNQERQKALDLKDRIDGMHLTIKAQAAPNGKIFGSVSAKDVSNALEDQGIYIDKRNISGTDSITNFGTYNLSIKLYDDVTASISVTIEAE